MKKWIRTFYENDVIRYLFFGGCTTLVNLVSFRLLRMAGIGLNIANLISIILAVLFTYVVNSRFVFKDEVHTLTEHLRPFGKFIAARAFSMLVELGGVWLLVEKLHMPEMGGKLVTQVIVIVLNYIFSKFFVFTSGKHNSTGGDVS